MLQNGPIRGQTLNKLAQDRVKNYITSQHLKPGDPLPPETQFASELGISRSSMREAIKSLESLGIIEVKHGSGIFVRGFNFDSMMDLLLYSVDFDQNRIAEICKLRKWLETAAIVEVIDRITVKETHQIEALFERWEHKIVLNSPTANEDREFHQLLFSPLKNHSLMALLDIFWVAYHAVQVNQITTDLQPATTIQDHRDILAAVLAHDTVRAQECLARHFGGIERRLAQILEPVPSPD
jgi:DNA-binding FadR family transcriptional regulator